MHSVRCLVALLAVMLAACTGTSARPESVLAGTTWKLTGWSEAGISPADFTITANFADGRVTGKAAVNNYFASYAEGPENKLTMSEAGSTMMAGPPAAMQAERTYLTLLGQVRSYSRAGQVLTLADPAGQMLLVFGPAP
jgi:heat shock protein HslJ